MLNTTPRLSGVLWSVGCSMQLLSAARLLAVSLLTVVPLTAGQSNGPGYRNGNPVSSKLSQTSPTDPWGLISLMVRWSVT